MSSNSVTISLPNEAMPSVEYLRSQDKLSSTVAAFLIEYGRKHNIK